MRLSKFLIVGVTSLFFHPIISKHKPLFTGEGHLQVIKWQKTAKDSTTGTWITVNKIVRIEDYFDYFDSLVKQHSSKTSPLVSEHIIVRANPWIIDTLANTDYYRMIARDSFVFNQKKSIVLQPGDSLVIPDSLSVSKILETFDKTHIDINIPEFTLRIYERDQLLYTFPVRVGRSTSRYLALGSRVTNLRTQTGSGTVIRHEKHPVFYNPVDGKRFYYTKRDDGKTTLMPQIPWIETEINGIRNGQMIHPTTNPETLGKAYSNGCIGTKESDAWIIYYYAPLGTKINIRYDLDIIDNKGDSIKLKDIYNRENKITLKQ